MIRRTILGLLILVIFPLSLKASLTGLTVQTWNRNPATGMLTVTLVNLSKKEVTAFDLAIGEPGKDHYSEFSVDYIARLSLSDETLQEQQQVRMMPPFPGVTANPDPSHVALPCVLPTSD
jgi:hypothetical protein